MRLELPFNAGAVRPLTPERVQTTRLMRPRATPLSVCWEIMRSLALLVLSSAVAFAANSPFDGRWDITVAGDTAQAWWLGLEGAGTPAAKGTFISDHWGALNPIDEISVQGNELTFGFRYKQGGREIHHVYSAHIEGGRLIGTFTPDGSLSATLHWTGVHAPVIRDKDDGSWREGKPIALFDKKTSAGWRSLTPDKPFGWTVENGLLTSTGGASNLISERKFWNFKLHVEFRLAKDSNSGIGLRARYEVQILDDYGRPPDTHGNGALYSRILPTENASKPAGEWQTYDIRFVGRQVTVVLNGKKVIDKGEVEGLTAIASDANEGQPGPLILQGDHGPVEFREINLTPLVK